MAVAKRKARSGAREAEQEVDRQLARYRSMRNFSQTAEPSGGDAAKGAPAALPFVIQKHAATRLHYDFRLGWRGVLKSWAVAKGPSYFTGDKRLAVQVEDHPMEYGGFEGTIPKGQYGGGTVMVWDQGTWEPVGDVDEGLEKGSLKFTLHGGKLDGRWTLVRMGGRAASESKPNWLLIKEHDGKERSQDAAPITDEMPDSIVTGRSLEQIGDAEDHVWQSHAAASATKRGYRSPLKKKLQASLHAAAPKKSAKTPANKSAKKQSTAKSWLEGAPRAAMPGFVAPQLATPAREAASGAAWLHELKLDGYRMQAHVQKGSAVLYTRSGLDWTHRMRAVADGCAALPVETAVLDGEVIAPDAEGMPSFGALQAAFEKGDAAKLQYFVFDLLYLDGHDTRSLPLTARRALLQPLLRGAADERVERHVLLSEQFEKSGADVYAHACSLGAEGVISKQADAPYTSGRSPAWLKLKCTHRQEFVIGGFTLPGDGGDGVGSLLLGYYREGSLVHCGRCGTGFSRTSARAARAKLEALRQKASPYAKPLTAAERRDAQFVRPELVCEVEFAAWTDGGSVRHASFQGLREDKPADDVVREDAGVLPMQRGAKKEAKPASLAGKSSRATKPARARGRAAAAPNISHPDKVLDAASGVTKQALADYYAAAAEAMLPHLEGRAASIVRCPNGTAAKCFFQKHVRAGLPAGIGSIDVPDRENAASTEPYIVVEDAEALTALAQLGVLELHPWGSRAASLEQPDRLIFDLDPDESLPWSTVVESAREVRDFLKELRLETFVKSTGGKGLHVVAALEPLVRWPELRLFARGVAAALESAHPALYLIKMTKAARKGKIFLDWMRNERGATAIAPWSPRARAGMRVAAPLAWKELDDGPPNFAVGDLAEWQQRLRPSANPWAKMRPQPLSRDVLEAVLEQTGGDRPARRKR